MATSTPATPRAPRTSRARAPATVAPTAPLTTTISIPEGSLVDFIDGRFRPDKPEERVRQNILKRLVNSLKFPKERIVVEHGVKLGSIKKRVDVGIYKVGLPQKQENIELIVECKKETVSAADSEDGVEQLKSYMAACLNCEWGLWTNGKHREVWRKVRATDGSLSFIEEVDIPSVSGPKPGGRQRSELDSAVGDVLLYAFKSCHNQIHLVDGLQKDQIFFELLKVIFCKIYDEKNVPNGLEFYVKASELNDPDGQIACKNRIEKIFGKVRSKFSQFFPDGEQIELNPRSLVRVVAELQNFSLLSTDIDIKGKAYEEIVGSNLKGDRGQFFTPRNIMQMAVEMINPSESERTLDLACGTGGFIVTAMNHRLKHLKNDCEIMWGRKSDNWTPIEQKQFNEKIAEVVGTYFFGFDITPALVKAAKMNMVMNNDGSGNMLQTDSLLPPYMWSTEFRDSLANALNLGEPDLNKHIKGNQLTGWEHLARFHVITTNPPFGSKILIKDLAILHQYSLAKIWEKPSTPDGRWSVTTRFQSGVPPEQLFVERCVQFLVPGGRMAIVLPDSILGSPGLGYIRQWLLQETKLIASIDLHQDAFQPHTGVQTSILILQKKTIEEKTAELVSRTSENYNVFMAIVDKVGHDKRGKTVFKRDEHGAETLQEVEDRIQCDDGTVRIEMHKERIVDDQSTLVAEVFKAWKASEGVVW